jgi:hypothetical protein
VIKHVVYKYPFRFAEASFKVPAGSTVRHVGIDGQGEICVWIEHKVPNEVNVTDERAFLIIGTGHAFAPTADGRRLVFHGTVITPNGLVFHVYEAVKL